MKENPQISGKISRRLNIAKMTIFTKMIYKCINPNIIPIKIPAAFFFFFFAGKGCKITKTISKKNKIRTHSSQFLNQFQS